MITRKHHLRRHAALPARRRGGGTGSAGQSGDTQGLPDVAEAGSESVRELVEEGQYFEAEAVLGVESAAEPDPEGVQTREVPEDDVPPEYLGKESRS